MEARWDASWRKYSRALAPVSPWWRQDELLLAREEPDIAGALAQALRDSGVTLRLKPQVTAAEPSALGARLTLNDRRVFTADRVLLATGRTPNVADLGLETLGIKRMPRASPSTSIAVSSARNMYGRPAM